MRYELYHDVLAEPILDWRREYEQERARRAAVRRLVRVGAVLLSVAAVFAALGIWALVQRSDARRASGKATSLALAAASKSQLPSHVELALLLGLSAYQASPGSDAAGAAAAALEEPMLAGLEAILRGSSTGNRAIAFSPDGRTLASADFDGTLRLWDLKARKQLGELSEETGEVWSLDFSPDGLELAVAGEDGSVRIWDVRGRKQLVSIVLSRGSNIRSVAFSPNGRLLAAASDLGNIWLLDAHDHSRVAELGGGRLGEIAAIAFSRDGCTLASAGYDGAVVLWDVRKRARLATLPRQSDWVLCLTFSRDGQYLATGGADGAVRIWELRTHKLLGKPWTPTMVESGESPSAATAAQLPQPDSGTRAYACGPCARGSLSERYAVTPTPS
jgi:WD domain, G-beta repeat